MISAMGLKFSNRVMHIGFKICSACQGFVTECIRTCESGCLQIMHLQYPVVRLQLDYFMQEIERG